MKPRFIVDRILEVITIIVPIGCVAASLLAVHYLIGRWNAAVVSDGVDDAVKWANYWGGIADGLGSFLAMLLVIATLMAQLRELRMQRADGREASRSRLLELKTLRRQMRALEASLATQLARIEVQHLRDSARVCNGIIESLRDHIVGENWRKSVVLQLPRGAELLGILQDCIQRIEGGSKSLQDAFFLSLHPEGWKLLRDANAGLPAEHWLHVVMHRH